jgi:hypothetical protein
MGIQVVTTARSPWQNACVDRNMGSVRRECLDQVIIFGERHLRGVLSCYFQYHKTRTHLALDNCPGEPPLYTQSVPARSSPSRRSVVCIIATSDAPHNLSSRP